MRTRRCRVGTLKARRANIFVVCYVSCKAVQLQSNKVKLSLEKSQVSQSVHVESRPKSSVVRTHRGRIVRSLCGSNFKAVPQFRPSVLNWCPSPLLGAKVGYSDKCLAMGLELASDFWAWGDVLM